MHPYTTHVEKQLEHLLSLIVAYTPSIIGALFVLFIGLWLINRLSKVATKAMEQKDLDVSLRTFFRSLISVGLKVILMVTVAGMVGIGTTSFVTILGAAGLAVGLALQGSLSNFAGGVLLLIFKPYKVGDSIEAQGQSGVVTEIQVFNTILLTADLKTVILPNGAVSNGTIVNYTKHGILRGDVQVIVSVDNDIDVVKRLLVENLLQHKHILKNPVPEVYVTKMIDGGVTLSIKAYSLSEDYAMINSDVVEIAKKVFEQHAITLPLPKK